MSVETTKICAYVDPVYAHLTTHYTHTLPLGLRANKSNFSTPMGSHGNADSEKPVSNISVLNVGSGSFLRGVYLS